MPAHSAGVLSYRLDGEEILVFLAHPGGPFWAKRDEGAWSMVKGEYDPATEDARLAAAREFAEETGVPAPGDPATWLDLGQARQSSGKIVQAYAVEATAELAYVTSNTIEIDWPPRSGRRLEIPEVDRAEWMPLEVARARLVTGQRVLIDRLEAALGRD